MKVKIYILKDPYTDEIRYIGRTKNSLKIRLAGHCTKAKQNSFKTYKDNWILKLDVKPLIEEIEEIEGWEESYLREQILIKEYIEKGYRLVNLHDRGTGGLLRDISQEQREKISKKVKQLHSEGKLSCGRKAVDIYNLNGDFIISLNSYKEAAEYIGISEKQFQSSMKRKAKRIKKYQIVNKGDSKPNQWKQRTGELSKNFKPIFIINILSKEVMEFKSIKYFKEYFNVGSSTVNWYVNSTKVFKEKYLVANARLKLDELLEKQETVNQQPSIT